MVPTTACKLRSAVLLSLDITCWWGAEGAGPCVPLAGVHLPHVHVRLICAGAATVEARSCPPATRSIVMHAAACCGQARTLTGCKRACAFDQPRIAQGRAPEAPVPGRCGVPHPAAPGDRLGPLWARFAAVLRPRSGREAGRKAACAPWKTQKSHKKHGAARGLRTGTHRRPTERTGAASIARFAAPAKRLVERAAARLCPQQSDQGGRRISRETMSVNNHVCCSARAAVRRKGLRSQELPDARSCPPRRRKATPPRGGAAHAWTRAAEADTPSTPPGGVLATPPLTPPASGQLRSSGRITIVIQVSAIGGRPGFRTSVLQPLQLWFRV